MYVRSRRGRKRLMSEINVVPYIDVMLVLLVIFMVTAPLLTQGVDVDLVPAGGESSDDREQEPFIVTVDAQGGYFVNDSREAVTVEEMQARAAALVRAQPDTQFLVKGDRAVLYEKVVGAMVALQAAGVPSVGLVTRPPEEDSGG